MATKIALMFASESANDAILGQMLEYRNVLTEFGVSIVHIRVDADELQHAFRLIKDGKVGFAFTWLGIAQNLEVKRGAESKSENLWEAFGIPMLKILADLPAYFVQRHDDIPSTSVNLYGAREFAHFRRRWLPHCRAMTAVIPTFPLGTINRGEIDIATRRKGKLVFLKNGNSPSELRQLWQAQLTRYVAALISDMADEITPISMKPGVLHIGDFVADHLGARGLEPYSMPSIVCFFTAQLDDYLRRVKSRMIAEALLDFPVVVQGDLWHHLDFTGRRAQLIPGQDYSAARKTFAQQLGIIDMSPNVDTAPHERVQRAAGSYATVLTNRQSWMTSDFPEFTDLAFEFTPDSIKARVENVIANPDRYVELGIAFGERFREVHPRENFVNRVIELAELAALQSSEEKPPLQPYFVWPSPRGH